MKEIKNSQNISYALITPARNEESNIERVIKSVIGQTFLPKSWVIVSDGSTDRTDQIVEQYAREYEWIEFVRMPEHADRHFAAKVNCFNAGYAKLKGLDYEIIGNLDADISFDEDYFDFLMSKFAEEPDLGVAGTPFVENGSLYDYRFTNIKHVSGACQLFRRECFEDIGGYVPIKGGGIDWTAVTTARMRGWRTRTFSEKTCFHHRKMGTGNHAFLMTSFKQGQKDYFLGNHPLWEVFRALYQMTRKPYLLGGCLILIAFLWSAVKRVDRPISKELMKFYQAEQIARLKSFFRLSPNGQGVL